MPPRWSCVAVVVLAVVTSATLHTRPSSSQSQPANDSEQSAPAERVQSSHSLQRAVETLVQTITEYGGEVSVSIVDIESGRVLAAHNDRTPLNPASDMKLLTAAAALMELTPQHRFLTGLYGKRAGATVHGLVLRGYGDPSLRTEDLWRLVDELHDAGVRTISGDILVDQSFFDAAFLPPGYEQQPGEWAYFRAPVSAVALERNTIQLAVTPTQSGAPALAALSPPGFADAVGTVRTGDRSAAQDVRLELVASGPRLSAKLGGTIPENAATLTISRRVEDPTLFAGYVLKALLLGHGMQVDGQVRAGTVETSPVLAVHRSAPLGDLLAALGKESDNFSAEMVLKTLGGKAKRHGLGTDDGIAVVRRYLEQVGAADPGNVLRNGSGLFDTNRVTTATFTSVLRAQARNPATASEYISHLAVGGSDGTLRGRLRRWKKTRAIRAKTGTLSSVASLSGYVLAPAGRSPVAFSIIVNRVAGKVSGSRDAIDRCVDTLARQVWNQAATDD